MLTSEAWPRSVEESLVHGSGAEVVGEYLIPGSDVTSQDTLQQGEITINTAA